VLIRAQGVWDSGSAQEGHRLDLERPAEQQAVHADGGARRRRVAEDLGPDLRVDGVLLQVGEIGAHAQDVGERRPRSLERAADVLEAQLHLAAEVLGHPALLVEADLPRHLDPASRARDDGGIAESGARRHVTFDGALVAHLAAASRWVYASRASSSDIASKAP